MTTLRTVVHAAEIENPIFQIEENAEGKKVIHVDGYYFTAGEPGFFVPSQTWRHVIYSFYAEELDKVLAEGFSEWYSRTDPEQRQYERECSWKDLFKELPIYFGGTRPEPIAEDELSEDTPCGAYILAAPTEGPFYPASSDSDKARIAADPILIDNGETEFCVLRETVAEAIAALPGNWCCTVLDANTGQELASTFGNFIDRADPAFRCEIIDRLVQCQKNPDKLGILPFIEAA